MPTLLIFAPCEKIIIDKAGSFSLIGLMESISVSSPAGAVIPQDAVGPKEWAVFCQWQMREGESTRPFSQVLQILWPDQREFKKAIVQLPLEDSKFKQIHINIMGLPVGQQGKLTLNLWLELDSNRVTDIFFKTVDIAHAQETGK